MKYIQKPVEVDVLYCRGEAEQLDEIKLFTGWEYVKKRSSYIYDNDGSCRGVNTMFINVPGDHSSLYSGFYLVKYPDGEFKQFTKEKFEEKFEQKQEDKE